MDANADPQPISPTLAVNYAAMRSIYSNCNDVIFRELKFGGSTESLIVFLDGMVNVDVLDQHIIRALQRESPPLHDENAMDVLGAALSISNLQTVKTVQDAVSHIGNGCILLFVSGLTQCFAMGLAKWEKRSIEEPGAESVVRGPREGFTETISVNRSMLRRKIKTPALKMLPFRIGRQTQTEVNIVYIEGIAGEALVAEAQERITGIDIDGILESGYLEGLIEDNPFSPFPQMQATERPDVICAGLLEGRIAILVDGTPFVLVAPTTLFSMLQSPEDYYQRFYIGTLIRWLRYLFFIMTLVLPSLYVSILTYHQEMVPTSLLLSIAKSREDIPFPALVEALLMEISFEALREAGVRLPKQVGAAVSIVGALVIGQAATSAGLVSAPMVMVVAITGIASFMMPQYSSAIAIRMLRFPIMILAGMLGLLGLMLGLIIVVVHLCSLRSFGEPYMQPLAPLKGDELKDVLVRSPIWMMRRRPNQNGKSPNPNRQAPGLKPEPPRGNESS
ncbi:spore germination protein [Paenibacillus rhizovicinus]|uniref:Spore germination protein n=1 Tax=Paenibacillus rhizovicinus TaxID=2704463 RepID=A0A6C0P427_9BACL|nr:spore germination protein [Paenibacillus rhizovicinus]QHW33195.1 spore germination protein [Paenibacillus rhizovicinus]